MNTGRKGRLRYLLVSHLDLLHTYTHVHSFSFKNQT